MDCVLSRAVVEEMKKSTVCVFGEQWKIRLFNLSSLVYIPCVRLWGGLEL